MSALRELAIARWPNDSWMWSLSDLRIINGKVFGTLKDQEWWCAAVMLDADEISALQIDVSALPVIRTDLEPAKYAIYEKLAKAAERGFGT